MSIGTNGLRWIDFESYNTFPGILDARELTPVNKQKATVEKFSYVLETSDLTSLVNKIGATINHVHFFTKKNEAVIGELTEEGSLHSKPKNLETSNNFTPTTWALIEGSLVRSEGVTNASKECKETSQKVEKNGSSLFLLFQEAMNESGVSELSIALDPQIVCGKVSRNFVETTTEEESILKPTESEGQIGDDDYIMTYMSTQKTGGNPVEVGCRSWCQSKEDRSVHYDRHHRTS